MIERDRSAFVEQKAWEAQAAAIQHDSRKTYGIVRTLAGKSSARVEFPVMRKDGKLTKDESERQRRWEEHFTDVSNGDIVIFLAFR